MNKINNQKVRKETCIICKKEFNSLQETIKSGKLKGFKVINCFCSQKCRNEFRKKIRGN